MPVTVQGKFGRRLGTDRAELVYLVRGTTEPSAARNALDAQAAPIYLGMKRESVEVTEIDGINRGAWLGSARYAKSTGAQDVGESTFSFDTGGGTTHIVSSLETVQAYGTGAMPADNAGLIGATADGVEGADIITPVYQWSETHLLDPGMVTLAYRGVLRALTGSVNADAFKGTAEAETLFLGATGQQRGTNPWSITFKFASAPNRTDIKIGDGSEFTGIAKKGWEYLWVRYQPTELTGDLKIMTQKPVAVYVEKVYRLGDFAALGIGT